MVGVAVRANRQYIVASRWEHPLNAQAKNNYTAIVVYCIYYLGTTQQVLCVHGVALPHGDIFLLHRPFQARSRGCVQTKTSEGGRLGMRAAYNNFAPTGGSYQSVFRGTLPRRTASGVRNVAITRRHHSPFSLPLRLRPSHLLIVRGNCEAVCARSVAIPRRARCTNNNVVPIFFVFVLPLLSYCFSAGACPIILMYER